MAKTKTRKCQMCKEQGNLDDMVVELVGKTKPVKKFYHASCHLKFLEEKKFKEKEQLELDELTETIKRIYGVKELPTTVFTLIQKLRNGEPVFGRRQQIGKRYKQGYTYSLIQETFEHISETIEYWNRVKNFDGISGAFKYALTIVIDKIYFVEQRVNERKKKQELLEKHIEEVKNDEQDFQSSYKRKTSNTTDILDFLDD